MFQAQPDNSAVEESDQTPSTPQSILGTTRSHFHSFNLTFVLRC